MIAAALVHLQGSLLVFLTCRPVKGVLGSPRSKEDILMKFNKDIFRSTLKRCVKNKIKLRIIAKYIQLTKTKLQQDFSHFWNFLALFTT